VVLPANGAPITALAYSHDRKTLAVGAGSFVHLRDATTGELRRTFRVAHSKQAPATIHALAFATNDDTLAIGVSLYTFSHLRPDGGEIHLWDLKDGKETAFVAAHPGRIVGLAYLADGRTLVSTGYRSVKLWDANPLKERRVLADDISSIQALAVAPDDKA